MVKFGGESEGKSWSVISSPPIREIRAQTLNQLQISFSLQIDIPYFKGKAHYGTNVHKHTHQTTVHRISVYWKNKRTRQKPLSILLYKERINTRRKGNNTPFIHSQRICLRLSINITYSLGPFGMKYLVFTSFSKVICPESSHTHTHKRYI